MKNKSLIILALTPFILCACPAKQAPIERDDEPESVEPVDFDDEKTAANLKDDELHTFPSIFLRKLESYQTFKAITKGETVSHVVLFDVTQSIDVTVIRDEYSYLLNESHSSMVNTVHTAYFHEKEAYYKDNDGAYQLSDLTTYLNSYGTCPFDSAIEGYLISGTNVKSVTREQSESNYTFKLVFDKDTSTNNVKIQMKAFGGLDEYPSFTEDTTMLITVKNDFTPVSLKLHSSYKAKKIIETSCVQDYTVTYSEFNEPTNIPDIENIKGQFNK